MERKMSKKRILMITVSVVITTVTLISASKFSFFRWMPPRAFWWQVPIGFGLTVFLAWFSMRLMHTPSPVASADMQAWNLDREEFARRNRAFISKSNKLAVMLLAAAVLCLVDVGLWAQMLVDWQTDRTLVEAFVMGSAVVPFTLFLLKGVST